MRQKLEDEFDKLNINEELKDLNNLPVCELASYLKKLIIQASNNEQKFILEALEHICYMENSLESIDFGEEHENILKLLSKKVRSINNSALRAVIGEMLFKLNKDYTVLELTVDSYIDSFENTFSTEEWVVCFQYIENAINISKLLGKKSNKKNICLEKMYTKLQSSYKNDKSFISGEMIRILVQEKYGESERLYSICIDRADEAEKEKQYRLSRLYLEICLKDYISNDIERKYKIRKRIARTYEEEAQEIIEKDTSNYMLASNCIQSAIVEYRKIPNMKSQIDKLHRLMMGYQEKSLKYMKETSFNFELDKKISKAINDKIDTFKGKDKNLALELFAYLENVPDKEDIEIQVREDIKRYPLQHIFPRAKVNEFGKTITKVSGGNFLNDDTQVAYKMNNRAKLHFDTQSMILIEPIRQIIIDEHTITEIDLDYILNDNYMIPKERVRFYAKGLAAGFNGDFIISSHLLIPQLENSIRYILEKNDVVVTTISNEGIQEEKNVNTLLKEEKLIDILGEDIIFTLRALLIEKSGDNFRNDISHGLMSYERCEGGCAKYLWWLVWKMCVLYKTCM